MVSDIEKSLVLYFEYNEKFSRGMPVSSPNQETVLSICLKLDL